jgi:hypothetical protein
MFPPPCRGRAGVGVFGVIQIRQSGGVGKAHPPYVLADNSQSCFLDSPGRELGILEKP